MSSADEQPDDPRFEKALVEYLRRIDQGEHVDQAQFIAAHAELADALREYFNTAERIERMAAPPDETLDSDSPPAASSPPLDVIRYFGDYELLEEIGRGGMGVVYRARQVTLKRIVALKMILAGQLASDDDVKRFHAEAEAAANLQHPGIVPIFEVGLHEGQHYFSMGFVDGESLSRKVAEGPLPPREAAQIIEQVTRAIAYAHEHGVIHRDLKPGNVLIDRDGQPHIADFGLAKRIEDDSDLTRTGQIVGTPSYMSPEQASGNLDEIGPATDVYSLGTILYTSLVGRPPFQSANVGDTLNQVKTQDPVSPRQLNADVPRDLETICLKCLEKPTHKRYVTANELVEELQRFLHGEPIRARPIARVAHFWKWCHRNPVVAGLIATVAVVLLLGVGATSTFAVLANSRAVELRDKNAALRRNAKVLNAKRVELKQSNTDLSEAIQYIRGQKDRSDRQAYVSYIASAQLAWEHGQLGNAHRMLNRTEPRLRGWEFDYVYTLFNQNQHTFPGHNGSVDRVAFSPDGTRVVSASSDGTLKVWNADSGKEVLTLKGHRGAVSLVVFSPDGTRVVSAGGELDHPGEVKVWDVANGQKTLNLRGHGGRIVGAAFSPNGKQITSLGIERDNPGKVIVWDAASGQETLKIMLQGHHGHVSSVAFSSDGMRIVTGGWSNGNSELKVWDATSGKETLTLKGHTGSVGGVAFSPDGTRIVSRGGDGALRVWDVASGEDVLTFREDDGSPRGVAFSPDGKRIVSSEEGKVKVWDAVSGQERLTLKGHVGRVNGVAFSPDGTRIASGSSDGTLKLWDATKSQEARTFMGHTDRVNSVAFSPDGTQIASGSWDGTLRLWDAANGQETFAGHPGTITSVAFSPNGMQIVSGGADGTLKVWDAANGKDKSLAKGHTNYVGCVAFSPDCTQIVSGGVDGTVRVWDAANGQETLKIIAHTSTVSSVAFNPVGTHIVSGSGDRTLKVWNAASGLETLMLRGHVGRVNSVAFSPNGTRIVSGSFDGTLKVWNAATGQEEERLDPPWHDGSVNSVAWSPDGARIVSGGGDEVKLWDVETGLRTLTLKGHSSLVSSVAFSSDGTRIVSGSWDETLRLWDATRGRKLQQEAGR